MATAPGAEREAGEAASCPGRPVQSQRGEIEGAADTQGGGERKEEEGRRRGSQVCVRDPREEKKENYVCLCFCSIKHLIVQIFE